LDRAQPLRGVVAQDRRNYASRGDATRLVVEGLITGEYRWDLLQAPAVERILRRLAIRGLARTTSGGWVPSPPLQCPASIIPVDPDIETAGS
jgi:hypothetical protein